MKVGGQGIQTSTHFHKIWGKNDIHFVVHVQAQAGTHFHKIWGKNDIYLSGSRGQTFVCTKTRNKNITFLTDYRVLKLMVNTTLLATKCRANMTFLSLVHMQAQTGTHFHKIWGKNDIYLSGSRADTGRHSFSQNLGQK